MLTKAKLKELKKAWNSNMADAEVGPLLEHIAEQSASIAALESALAERERECERLKRESAEAFCAWVERLRVEGKRRGAPFIFETASDALREFRAAIAAADGSDR